MTKRNKLTARRRHGKAEPRVQDKLPFIEHLRELRRRLLYVAVTVLVAGAVAYGFEQQIINVLLHPSNGQQFIYTSPMGGMNFLFTVCLDIGIVVATPIIIYQLLAFVRPLMRDTTRRFLLIASGAAGAMALIGVLFGYFVGLPSALHFLFNQFTTVQVRPLITIQSYMQFVAVYLLGSALMFQLPLIVLLINRIKPLKPRKLLKYERHMIVGSLIVAFIMNPSPNLVDQLFVVIPILASYQIAIVLLWFVQRRQRVSPQLQLLRSQDAERQAERVGRQLEPFALAVPAAELAASTDLPQLSPDLEMPTVPAPVVIAIQAEETTASIPVRKPLHIHVLVRDTAAALIRVATAAATPAKPQGPRRFMDFMPKPQPRLVSFRPR